MNKDGPIFHLTLVFYTDNGQVVLFTCFRVLSFNSCKIVFINFVMLCDIRYF